MGKMKCGGGAQGKASSDPISNGGEADHSDGPKLAMETRDGSRKEDGQKELKEGAFLLGEPSFLDLGGGRLRCVETGHELLAKEKEAYGRTKACRLALIDVAIARKKPPLNMFQAHPTSKSQLVCKMTGDLVNKSEEHIWKHVNGKKFLNKLEQKEMEKHASAAVGKDAKQQKKQLKAKLSSSNKDERKDVNSNGSISEKTKSDTEDVEDPDFWIPPIGSRWDFDDGADRWDSHTNSGDDVCGLGNEVYDHPEEKHILLERENKEHSKVLNRPVDTIDDTTEKEDLETKELSKRTKRMSIAVGPSSFAPRKKKVKKNTSVLPNDS